MTDSIAGPRRTWMLDLDGVLWLADDPIPGSSDAIAKLREAGVRVAFFTNNSFSRRADQIAKFARQGIIVDEADFFGSAEAAAQLLTSGERCFVLGGAGIVEALGDRGVELVDGSDPGAVDSVVVGIDRDITFERLTRAVRAVYAGARLVATNDDSTYPTPDGPLPGAGSILAAVTYATGAKAVVAGKPYTPAADLVHARLGRVDVMVGDRPETDGLFSEALGAKYALVRSGVTAPGSQPAPPVAQYDAPDLLSLVESFL